MADAKLFAVLGFLTLLVLVAEYAGQISDWLNRSSRRQERVSGRSKAVPTTPTVEVRLAQAEEKLADLTLAVEELRGDRNQGGREDAAKKAAEFPLTGVVAWGMPLIVYVILMFTVLSPPPGLASFLVVLLLFYGFAGLFLFFGSDWAQQRWSTEGK